MTMPAASAPSDDAHPADGYRLEFQCFAQHSQWILGLPLLQRLGFRFFFGGFGEGAYVHTPGGLAYPLHQDSGTRLWYLRCHSPSRGRLVFGEGPGDGVSVELDLLGDSGAGVHCGGLGAEDVLVPMDGPGRPATAAGGTSLLPVSRGHATLFFPVAGRTTTVRAIPILGADGHLSTNREQHVRMVLSTTDRKGFCPRSPLLEGPFTHAGDSEAAIAVRSHQDGLAASDARFRTEAPVFVVLGHGQGSLQTARSFQVGDEFVDDDYPGSVQVVTAVRSRHADGDARPTFFVTTAWKRDATFASEGPEDALQVAGAVVMRGSTQVKLSTGAPGGNSPSSAPPFPSTRVEPAIAASGARRGRYGSISPQDAADRLYISNPATLAALQKCAIGLIAGPAATLRREDYFRGGMSARPVPGHRTVESQARDMAFRPGERFSFDVSPRFEGAFDGFHYFVLFVCRRSTFVRVYPIPDKSAQSFINLALEPLRVFVRTMLPGVRLLSIHGDCDTSLSQSGHGADQDNSYLKAYNAGLADPILVQRSPADVHSMNGCEPQAKRLYYLGNMISKRWSLGRTFNIDVCASAAEVLNDTPVPGSRIKDLHSATRREVFTGHTMATDLSRWRGEPGQSAWVHIAGAKANLGEVKAKAAIFLYPLPGAGGFVLRLLDSRRLVVAYSVSLVNDRDIRHCRLAASDDLRDSFGRSPRGGDEVAARLRSLFAEIPGADVDSFVVRLDPLGGSPVRLEPVVDAEGELTLDTVGARSPMASPHAPAAVPEVTPTAGPQTTSPPAARAANSTAPAVRAAKSTALAVRAAKSTALATGAAKPTAPTARASKPKAAAVRAGNSTAPAVRAAKPTAAAVRAAEANGGGCSRG
jgi:hypothetical protein